MLGSSCCINSVAATPPASRRTTWSQSIGQLSAGSARGFPGIICRPCAPAPAGGGTRGADPAGLRPTGYSAEIKFDSPPWNGTIEDRSLVEAPADRKRLGMCHNSAINFCAAVPGAVALVLSEDGPARAMIFDGEKLLGWPDCMSSVFVSAASCSSVSARSHHARSRSVAPEAPSWRNAAGVGSLTALEGPESQKVCGHLASFAGPCRKHTATPRPRPAKHHRREPIKEIGPRAQRRIRRRLLAGLTQASRRRAAVRLVVGRRHYRQVGNARRRIRCGARESVGRGRLRISWRMSPGAKTYRHQVRRGSRGIPRNLPPWQGWKLGRSLFANGVFQCLPSHRMSSSLSSSALKEPGVAMPNWARI